ncbi:MAG: serine hydrolase domain-containing protein [Pseudomonadota bacterium]|jgi:CubicO group peptidase (beta-lactamase class C family)|nr:beta-lactamase family protein [Pseudomonadales bacterium]MEE3171983.1 serine hydrolase domain-containing protein [Pseudomonadota bacterium]|tara:strand:+ start:4519 stop:5751 length:1233 start_codon:yes stop_codon:yes gene_type:complete
MIGRITVKFITTLITLNLILFGTLSYADIEQARLDAVTADLQARIDEGKLSGAVVMIAQNGEIQLRKALGYQNVEDEIPMQEDTIFRIFSMTKPITGTALMVLHDEGKFELNDTVEKYLPELGGMEVFVSQNDDGSWVTEPANHPMTIRELMSHTGGLLYTPPLSRGPVASAYAKAGINNLFNYTLEESIPALADIPLGYQPGTQWVYSISVDVQGYLVERLSGQKFDEFLQERLFDPLDMAETGFFVKPENADRLARQYQPRQDGTLARTDTGAFLNPPKFLSGGGGLTSTAGDYMKFVQMHLNGGELNGKRVLSKEAVEIMRSNQLPDAVPGIGQLYPGNGFGVDFAIVNDSAAFQGAPLGTHWWWGIAGSWFWIDPVSNIGFIGMIQNSDILYSIQVHAAARAAMYQ